MKYLTSIFFFNKYLVLPVFTDRMLHKLLSQGSVKEKIHWNKRRGKPVSAFRSLV